METRQEPETKNNKFCFSSEYKTLTFHKFKRMSKESRTSSETALKIQDNEFLIIILIIKKNLKKKRKRQQHGV